MLKVLRVFGIFLAVQVPSSSVFAQTICAPMHHEGPEMCIQPVDETSIGTRIPVILIHGWNRARPGPPNPEVWNNLIAYSGQMPWVAERFKFYRVTYYSNLVSVSDIGSIMAELIGRTDIQYPDFARQKLFIIGHSMGGLVARSYMQEWQGGERVLRLVTLATPHHGTPLANGPARDAKAGEARDGLLMSPVLSLLDNLLFGNAPWYDYNRYDLHADAHLNSLTGLDYERFPQDANIWLDRLNDSDPYREKSSRYGGVIHAQSDWNSGCEALDTVENLNESGFLDCLALLTNGLYGLWNDGIVPNHSASRLCESECRDETLFGYNHNQMAEGRLPGDSYLFGAILGDLSDFVSFDDRRFSRAASLGNSADEAFHNLRGWGDAGWDRRQGAFRNQSLGAMNYVDLFVPKIFVPYVLSFKRGAPCGNGQFYAFIRVQDVDIPLDGQILSEDVLECRMDRGVALYRYKVPGKAIIRNRITVGFLEWGDPSQVSPIPMYYVRMD